MKHIRFCALIMAMMTGFAAFAAEIAFTNGSGDGDLSKPANWEGGSLPGVGVTGVVSVASHGTSFVVGSSVSIGGLKFTGVTTKVTVSGDGQLTLGEGGLTLDSTGGFALNVNTATSADQTWTLGGGEVDFNATISGTWTLTLKSGAFAHFRRPPNYGGKIVSSVPIKYYEAGTFCNTFEGSAKVYFMITGNVEVAHSTLFPGGSYKNTAWDPNTEWVRQDYPTADNGYSGLILDSGTFAPGGVGFSMSCGYVRQTGGIFDGTSGWGPFIGDYHAYSPLPQQWDWGKAHVAYYLEGGELNARQIFLGMYYNVRSKPAQFIQTGGSVKVDHMSVGGGNQSPSYAFSEYVMGGGLLDIGMSRTERSRALSIPGRGGQDSDSPGVFTQTNGTVKAYKLMWCSDYTSLGGSEQKTLNNGYAAFELKGGRFELGAGGWTNASSWCRTATNCGYSAKFYGGTFAPQTEQTGRMIMTMPPSDKVFTFENDKTFTQIAPIYGAGTLRKTGSGMLTVSDATDFRGNLEINQGTFAISGAVPPTTDDTGALIWTGDDIAEKNSFGASGEVENLVSTDGSCTFVRQEVPEGSSAGLIKDKVTISADVAFAGHKSIYLNYNYLGIPAANNPLNGATNFTVVLVYRSNKGDWTCGENASYLWQYSSGILGNADDAVITMSHTRSGNISSTPRFVFGAIIDNDKRQMYSEMDYNMNDNRAHVAILSYAGNQISIVTDGLATNYFYASATTPAKVRRWFNKDIYLGGMKNTAYTHNNQICTATRIAELRIYPNRALDKAESFRLGATLAQKYGINDSGIGRFSAVGGELVSAAVPADPAPTGYDWDADTLSEANEDGVEITEWPTVDGATAVARKSESNSHANKGPSLCKNAVNGHSSLKFSRAIKTSLGVGGSSNPLVNPLLGLQDFAIAVVFRTTDDETQGNGSYGGSVVEGGDGIFGMRTYNFATHDCGITYHHYGTLQPAWGSGKYVDTVRPLHLNDNVPHVAVLSRNSSAGTYIWSVDGVVISSGSSAANALTSETKYPLLFGVTTYEQDFGFFEGEILAARAYKRALTNGEVADLSAYYAAKYGFRLAGQMPMDLKSIKAAGISATNITVAAGAVLRLPYNVRNPFVMKSGVTLSGSGTVEGVVRYGNDVVFDLGAERPAIESIQLVGCTVKAGEAVADGSSVSKVSGTIKVDVTAIGAKMKSVNKIMENLDPSVIGTDVVFEIAGANPKQVLVQYDPATKMLVVRRKFTSVVVIR